MDPDAKDAPRVSVYVPTRNRAAYLSQAIESVLGQTFRDLELVVSDNASTDATAETVRGFDDERLSYLRRPTDLGLLGNFNACTAATQAPYLLVLADDEQLYPDHLARCVDVLDANPQVGMVHTAFDVVGPDGELVAADASWVDGPPVDRVEPGAEFARASIRSWSRVAASTALMRVAALPSPVFAPEDFPPADFGLWLRMAREWDIAFVGETLAAYRIHPSSHSAAYGTYTPGGYVDTIEHLLKGEEVKLRLLGQAPHAFPDRRALIRAARHWTRFALVNRAARLSEPECRLGPTVRHLLPTMRARPSVAVDWRTWRLLVGRALGRRAVARLKGAGRRPEETAA
jgi:hypothetical protein